MRRLSLLAHAIGVVLALGSDWAMGQDRSRIEKNEFSIVPPPGWEVQRDYGGSSFMFQLPMEPGAKVQSAIEVKVFKGDVYIDRFTARSFGEKIEEKITKSSRAIDSYRIRSSELITMSNGKPGLLYYADMSLAGAEIMQMHILISSQTNHFLTTFTDSPERFADPNNQILRAAYLSMTSAEVRNPVENRFKGSILTFIVLGTAAAFGVAFLLVRSVRHSKTMALEDDEMASDDSPVREKTQMDEDDEQQMKLVSHLTDADSDMDHESWNDADFPKETDRPKKEHLN